MTTLRSRPSVVVWLVVLTLVAIVGLGLVGGVSADHAGGDRAAGTSGTVDVADVNAETNVTVTEEAYVEPAPEPGDLYYEAGTSDWVSYVNPRDEYRSPYLGDASGKIGVTLLNEAGEPIVGETVPNTTVTVPTGESLAWHSKADPITVQFPLTDHYERPLDADQFGTTPELPQGDGYMDAHTIEIHGPPEDATIEYGEARIEGEHADDIEVVGYVQQAHDSWDSDVDPIEDAESYEDAGGWTFDPDHSHGQAIVVLQLDRDDGEGDSSNGEDESDTDGETGSDGGDGSDADNGNESDADDENASDSGNDDDPITGETDGTDETDEDEPLPGFGIPAVIVALAIAAFVGVRRSS